MRKRRNVILKTELISNLCKRYLMCSAIGRALNCSKYRQGRSDPIVTVAITVRSLSGQITEPTEKKYFLWYFIFLGEGKCNFCRK